MNYLTNGYGEAELEYELEGFTDFEDEGFGPESFGGALAQLDSETAAASPSTAAAYAIFANVIVTLVGRAVGKQARTLKERAATYCSNRSMNQRSTFIQISSLPTWSSMPCSRLGLSLTSITMKPESVSLT